MPSLLKGLPALSVRLISSSTEPCATRTPGSCSTLSSTFAEKAGASSPPSSVLVAILELMTASAEAYDSS